MTYKLKFHPGALKEWNSLSQAEKGYFKKKLKQRPEHPHVPGSRLSGDHNLYKKKRMRPPLRLTYYADDKELIIIALSVGKRDSEVYSEMIKRYEQGDS